MTFRKLSLFVEEVKNIIPTIEELMNALQKNNREIKKQSTEEIQKLGIQLQEVTKETNGIRASTYDHISFSTKHI